MTNKELSEEDTERLRVLKKRVSDIVSRITVFQPFLSAVFPVMERRYHFDPRVTAYVNGREVGFGVEFCEQLSNEELMFLCLHESMHVILMHIWRQEGRNPALFNIACDAVINVTLKNLNFTMPKGGVLIPWVTEDMGAEEIYARLLRENPPPPPDTGGRGGEDGDSDNDPTKGQTGGGGWDGNGDMAPAIDPADAANMEATIVTAAKMAKTCGDKSALVDRILGGSLTPSIPWSEVLRDLVTQRSRNDYSYRRPNRRMIQHKVVLPTLYSEEIGGLVVGVDTSGSVGPEELNQIAAEITAIVHDTRPAFVEVVYCDSKVAGVERFGPDDQVVLHAKGGGGTAFEPVFQHVLAMSDEVEAVIYLTDLCGDYRSCTDPGCLVVWGSTYRSNDAASVPFGTVIPVIL